MKRISRGLLAGTIAILASGCAQSPPKMHAGCIVMPNAAQSADFQAPTDVP